MPLIEGAIIVDTPDRLKLAGRKLADRVRIALTPPQASGTHCRLPMNYAVIRTGGKQYRIAPGDVIRVESLPAEAGATIELAEVLLAAGDGGVRIGTPLVSGVKVTARILEQTKAKKILVFHKKRRKNERRRRGHRQLVTTLKVLEIQG